MLSACHRDQEAKGPFEKAGAGVDHAADKTGAALTTAATATGNALDKAGQATGKAFERVGQKLDGQSAAPAGSSPAQPQPTVPAQKNQD